MYLLIILKTIGSSPLPFSKHLPFCSVQRMYACLSQVQCSYSGQHRHASECVCVSPCPVVCNIGKTFHPGA